MTIVLRGTKGSALTHEELDGNFQDLEEQVSEKLAAADLPPAVANYRGQGNETMTAAFAATAGASSLPVDDTIALVRDPDDPTKLLRFDIGDLSTDTTAVVSTNRSVNLASGGTFVEQTDFSNKLGFAAPTTKTIASGVITPDAGITLVDTEGEASEDALDTIVQTNFPEGSLLLIQSVHADRNVVVTNAAGGAGQIVLADGANLILDNPGQQLLLRSATGDEWIEVGRFWGNEKAAFRTWLDLGALALADTVGSSEITSGAVGPTQLASTAVTPGEYSNATFTVDQQGRLTAAASGDPVGGNLSTVLDDGTTITVGDAITGTHRILTAETAITLTLDAQGSVGTRVAFSPGGAGAVGVEVESGAGYRVPGDDYEESARTDAFVLTGYGYFECVRNTDDDSAEWAFVGDSDLPSTVSGDVTFTGDVVLPATTSGLTDFISGRIPTVDDATYNLVLKASYPFTVNSLAAKTASGTCNAKLTIEGVDVTGITALAVSSTEDSDDASGANSVAIGNTLALVLSSNSSGIDLDFTVAITRA